MSLRPHRVMGAAAHRLLGVRRETLELYRTLTEGQRLEVAALLAPDLLCGWVPKHSDVDAAMSAVLHRADLTPSA